MRSKDLKSPAKLTAQSVKAGAKQKNKREIEGYYFDGKKLHILYQKKR